MRRFPEPPHEAYAAALGCKDMDQATFPTSEQGYKGVNQWLHTRFELTGRWPSITLEFTDGSTTLKVPHLRQTLDAVEQRVSPVLGGRERGKAKRVAWSRPCDLP